MKNPLAEVFGFPPHSALPDAIRSRKNRLCPYNNRVPSCTKDKANDPLGVCSIYDGETLAITCPVRFRQDWRIAEHAAAFFFPERSTWTALTEVRLNDCHGRTAGNIDLVLVSYDERGRLLDFGTLEVQAVYISGNIRRPFERYMQTSVLDHGLDGPGQFTPRADYLSSSRKRLAPQLIYKGGILNSWGKKQAIALHSSFFKTLPTLPLVGPAEADLAWFIYDLQPAQAGQRLDLVLSETVYTRFKPALERITIPEPGPLESFVEFLQGKLDEKLEGNLPDTPALDDLFEQG